MEVVNDGNEGGGGDSVLDRWNDLRAECQRGLETAMSVSAGTDLGVAAQLRLDALGRAGGQTGTLAAAAGAHNVDWTMLAAIGIRESGFLDVLQSDGQGAGVFQIDVGKNKKVTVENARNLAWAADWVAATLAANFNKLAGLYPNFDAAHLMQATAASWNLGVGGISGNPDTIDVGSPRNNYGSNIMDLMTCFH
jgi:hypothetical protein